MLYHAYQAQADLMWPLRTLSKTAAPLFDAGAWGVAPPAAHRQWAAAFAVFNLAEVTHARPAFDVHRVEVAGQWVPVTEEVVHVTPFATLLRFKKASQPDEGDQPKVMLVAPMSGHFATLLRDTIVTMLPDHDVYVTDWHNIRDVPLSAGRFGLDDYTEHLMRFTRVLGPGSHVVAICQPCVSALCAVALMSQDRDPATPASLTLMAGPIDCRIRPTAVNELATTRPIDWFEKNLISVVPWRHRGGGRRVYPGFVQLTAFMNMNKERHVDAFKGYYADLARADDEVAQARAAHTRKFYEEYFAVADLPAEFYLETVRLVFQEFALPQGQLRYRGRLVEPAAITRTALTTVEGERDDICAPGQTLAAQDLCTQLRPHWRTHYVQADVGHYGVFSGSRWRQAIYPMVRGVIHAAQR